MATIVPARQFDEHDRLDDWRYLLGRIEAMFVASSYEAATTLALRIAERPRPRITTPTSTFATPGECARCAVADSLRPQRAHTMRS